MHLLLTACTQRKRSVPSPELSARNLPIGSAQAVNAEWASRISAVQPAGSAGDVYCGRSIVEASSATRAAAGNLYVVSAGLGLVCIEETIPSYNLTVTKGGPDYIVEKFSAGETSADWWRLMSNRRSLSELSDRFDGLILVALPSPYLRMIAHELTELRESSLERVRILSGSDNGVLPSRLSAQVIPYDGRLDGPQSPIRGTKSDFASRALRHFVEAILPEAPRAEAASHAKKLESVMATWDRHEGRPGTRMSDTEIKTIARDNWARVGGSSTKLLRLLRDELNIACEQKRFARLAAEVRDERASQ